MSKQYFKKGLPQLRFLEFKDESEWNQKKLLDPKVAIFVKDKGKVSSLTLDTYISTENILPDYQGVVTASKLPPSGSFTLYKNNDVLISNIRPYLKKVWHADKVGAASNDILVIRAGSDVNSLYLLYLLKNDNFINYMMSSAKGVKMPRGDIESIRNYPVFVPEREEQTKIAECLSSLDDVITTNTKKLDSLKLHKKGLMQKLFPAEGERVPELRFDGFDGCWGRKPFSKLFEIGSGKDHKHLADGDIPVYGSGGYMRSVNDYLYEGKSACIGRKGTINKPMLLAGKFWTVDTLFYTHSFKNCIPEFIYLLFQNIDWLKLNEAGGVPSLSKVIINKIEVFIPEEEEQQRIVDCVSSLDELIKIESDKIEVLKEYKKGLMQQLFPEIEESIA
ncbi:TPA: restriction endonuclease subunit S [Vibrio parahaemolyticus]